MAVDCVGGEEEGGVGGGDEDEGEDEMLLIILWPASPAAADWLMLRLPLLLFVGVATADMITELSQFVSVAVCAPRRAAVLPIIRCD